MALVRITVARGVMAIVLGATLILTADRHDSLSTWLASAWAVLGGAVLLSAALLMRRRLLARPDDRADSTSQVAS
jgi:drug/metabolite transporter (DMT)-like permease